MIGARSRVVARATLGALVLFATLAARLRAATCFTGGSVLCLNAGRFAVEVQYQDFQGHAGSGHAVGLTGDTGYFWFFTDTNVELVVKVLDARGINGSFWVFYGALTNVPYTMTVTDTVSGAHKSYTNPSGTFASAGDTGAFPQAPGSPAVVPSPDTADSHFVPKALGAASPTCTADPAALCLSSGRFRVEVNFTDSSGHDRRGQAIALTSDTGYFWFFNQANVELVVKALDARGVNGKYWVFFGALSDVAYEVVVLDTATGESKRYRNPKGRFASTGDTAAFPLSPGTPVPAVTEVGTPDGSIASASIGSAGGTLVSQDGEVTLTIPPGAVPGATTFTIEPITNEAPGGIGDAYRLGPEGQTFAVPVGIEFRYDPVPPGTFGQSAAAAYQDAQHAWRVVKSGHLDAVRGTLAVSTTHLSDWSHLLGFALKPFRAKVLVGQSLGLALVFCSEIEDDELTSLTSTCTPEAGDVRATNWAVNGVAGGSGTTGFVSAAGDYGSTFTAPAHRPSPNVESVSATLGRGNDVYQVASIVTIVDRSSWVGASDSIDNIADVTGHTVITWTLESTTDNVSLYRPSGVSFATYEGCIVNPDFGPVDPNGLLRVNFNDNPPTFSGTAAAFWPAHFNCPPDQPFEGYGSILAFDANGTVSADGTTIEGTDLSLDAQWTIRWHFTRQ